MSPSAEQLAKLFDALPEQEQKTLLDFAEFLQSRAPAPSPEISHPLDIPRPDEESVIAAIKRLNQTYPMVERRSVFNETSELMMQHMMQGRAAVEIIDELEAVFEQKFRKLFEGDE